MSAIQKELAKACGIDPDKYTDRASLHAALVKGVNDPGFTDKDWEGLSVPAQDWYNAAADEMKAAKKANETPKIKEFPDYEAPRAQEETRSRRRSADDGDDDKKSSSKGESMAVEKLKEGDRVKLTTKRGKTIQGEVIENSKRKEFVVVKGPDGEDEVDYDKVDSVEVFHGTAGQPEDVGPAVGDEVKFTTKRGKSVSGVITELTKDTIVLDKTDDFDLERIDGDITILKKGGGAKDEGRSSRRGAKDEDEDKGGRRSSRGSKEDDGEKNKRSTNADGVTVGGRIRELLSEDLEMTKDEVAKVLKKENVEYRDATLNMIYRDTSSFIDMLRKEGKLKK